MKAILYTLVLIFIVSGILFVAGSTLAADGPYLGLEYGRATGLGDTDIRFATANVIGSVLGLLGIISVVIIIYAGFKWMTSGGNDEDVKSAQKILMAAVIGLVIVMAAYSIVRFILPTLFKATTGYNYTTVEDNY